MTDVITALDNPYWDAVREHVNPTGSLWGTPEVRRVWGTGDPDRHQLVGRYSWTITDPETVAFVAEHSGGRLVDPMAGTGYWGWLLAQVGVDVASYDVNPPALDAANNCWHRCTAAHATVHRADAVDSVQLHPDRTLLLSWPPYDYDARPLLAAYSGQRVIYIGEHDGGCCADAEFFQELRDQWVEVASRVPVQWLGMHDYVTVYDRATGGTPS